MTSKEILIRLYKNYTSKYLNRILIAGLFSILVAGSTAMIAYLLDPAIKKIFVEKDQTLIYLIPIAIILAFATKGFTLFFAKANMIHVAENVKKNIQSDMMVSLINADTKVIDSKHTGKFVSNLTNDTSEIVNLVSVVLLNLFKDTLTLFGLLFVMFYQNWKLSLIAIIMIPFASYTAQKLGKRIGKVATVGMENAGFLSTHLMEIFKNHKLMKIFQRESYENARINEKLEKVKEASKKMATIFIKVSPIMETLTGIMIALLIFYSGKLIIQDEIDINNFFSFLAAMMLAYQPVRSLATLNMGVHAGLSAARRILPVIDEKIEIKNNENCKDLIIKKGEINFNNVDFKYDTNATSSTKETLESLVSKTIASFNNDNLKVFSSVFRHSQFTGLVDDADPSILSNITTVSLGSLYTPNTAGSYSFTVQFGNTLYNPHSGHNSASGGVIASTGFFVSGNTNEMFFDDDGAGNLRIYYLVSGVRTYYSSSAGTVDYATGLISVSPIFITTVSNVDGNVSTAIRITATPASTDIVGKRNQILEIDTINSTVEGNQDTIKVNSAGGSTGYVTTTNYVTPSSY